MAGSDEGGDGRATGASTAPAPGKGHGWWSTLPGILTAAAAVLTAVTGLVVALNQAGVIGGRDGDRRGEEEPSRAATGSLVPAGTGPAREASGAAGVRGQRQVPLPPDVRVDGARFTFLAAHLAPYAEGRSSLTFVVRMTNLQTHPANFWNASFRLDVDGVRLAPTGELNEVVDGDSAKEGTLEFVVPDAARSVHLRITHGGATETVAIDVSGLRER